MSCRVVPGMADSTGRCRLCATAAGSKLEEAMVLISATSALRGHDGWSAWAAACLHAVPKTLGLQLPHASFVQQSVVQESQAPGSS